MALNVQKLAERLKEYEAGQQATQYAKLLWKPSEGVQTIRVVPYKYNADGPFVELMFYYKLAGQTYLAPCTFGKPDPIVEVVNALLASGSDEEKAIAAKLKPTKRIYCPIIVRGKEDEGVKFWGFGVEIHRQLLTLMTKPQMWGDITSLTEGNDLEVTFVKIGKRRNAAGEPLPDTTITPYPTKTPVVDPTRKDLIEKVMNQVDITTVFPLKSYEEIKDAVNKYLNPTGADEDSEPKLTPAQEAQAAAQAKAAAPSAPATSAEPANKNLAAEFAKFFDKKTAAAPTAPAA